MCIVLLQCSLFSLMSFLRGLKGWTIENTKRVAALVDWE